MTPKSEAYLIDCMEFMRSVPDKFFSLAVVDPPYGIGMSNSNKRTKPSRPNSYTHYPDFRYHEANWDDAIPSEDYFTELFRVSKNQIVWGANYFCKYLPSATGWIFWNKKNGLDNCFSDGEFAYSSKGVQSKYFECSTFHDLKGGKDRIHPTQKPIALYDWIFRNYANPNDTILDTHMGSQSSRISAYKAGLDYTGCELDPEYFRDGNERFNTFLKKYGTPYPDKAIPGQQINIF
jgi:site-specific DNA-methyltransferase (adenine-specific)